MQSAWPPAGFSEHEADQNTRFPDAIATDVAVSAPLPSSFPEHSAECDCIHFLRIKHVKGPANPWDADKILIAQPGILEGASAFYNIGANLVTRAYIEKGKYIEFWTVDRRPNCLEDLNGLKLARETDDMHDFLDYYYRGKSYRGQLFKGFLNMYSDAAWLAEMGMEQTVLDWNAIITRGIPNQSVRQKKVFLGGHSLGGFITGAYACWDFDGDPATTDDAGYNQCAGFFALDSVVSATPMINVMSGSTVDLTELVGSIPDDVLDLMRQGLIERYVSAPGIIDAEVMNLLTGLGYAAQVDPTGESELIDYMPDTQNSELTYRFYHSRNLAEFFAPIPSLKRFRYTNQALLALFTDDNSMPFAFVRASLGFFEGGPVGQKNFPIPADLVELTKDIPELASMIGMMGSENLAIPTDSGSPCEKKDGPLYGWLNYNQLDSNSPGWEPFTDPSSEVTDINDFARSVGALPMDFVEKYFPMRLTIDSLIGTDGTVHADGVSQRPVLDITAGDGPKMGGNTTPPGSPIIPGYNHLDVITAAPVQNNGQPEPVSTYLLEFIFQ
ncbi:MAG: hypothetical protein A2176_04295 [Spirochaetes bacterium RBG_13_51_14]|nr:MAG: hypothetical protein A2176_04295 [Spirochaetes bacterium RBG_13_51_14]